MILGRCRWCGSPIEWIGSLTAWRSAVDASFKCGDRGLWHMRATVDTSADLTLDHRPPSRPALPSGDDQHEG